MRSYLQVALICPLLVPTIYLKLCVSAAWRLGGNEFCGRGNG
jgi:hypothetical protein